MTNQSDFDKQEWRERNLTFLKSVAPLWQRRKFQGAYLEYLGTQGNRMYDLLKGEGCEPSQFIGVDNDIKVIVRHRLNKVEFDTELVDDGMAFALNVSRQPREYPVTAFGFDTVNVGNQTWWADHGHNLKQLVTQARHHEKTRRSCAFILNHVLDARGGGQPSEHLVKHVTAFEQWARFCSAPLNLLAGFDVNRVNDREFGSSPQGATAGGVEIYRSSTLRMVTIRFWIDGTGSSPKLILPRSK